MFKKDSIFYDINSICKMICVLILLIAFLLLKQPPFLVFIGIFLWVISLEFKKTSILSMVGILLSIVASFYPQFLWIPKILLFCIYLSLVKKLTNPTQLRYMLEVTLYKFQSKKITFHILYLIYFFRHIKENMKVLDRLREEYGMRKDLFYFCFSLKKAWKKSKYEMNDLITMNSIRFYNYSKKRTYVEKPTWERWDTKYLLFHIMIFIVIYMYGR